MRYLVGFMCVLAGLVALPQSASVQADEEGATSEPNLEQPAAPSSEQAPKEPALQLKLDDAGVEVVPSPPWTLAGYTEEIERRMRETKRRMRSGGIVLGVSLGVLAGGVALVAVAASADDISTAGTRFLGGTLLILGGVVGTGIGATTLGSANQELQELRELQQASYSQPRRVQWDLAQSRLVF